MRKPTVLTKCAANAYTNQNERIIEFLDCERGNVGGLISFRRTDKGLLVRIYRCDPEVQLAFEQDSA